MEGKRKTLLQGIPTDQATYSRMIGGLMYLIVSHPDIAFATFVCARYQARPMVKHLKEVKRIFRYLRQPYNIGLWYLKDSGFELIAYSDADHAGCKDGCKSTLGGLQFIGQSFTYHKQLPITHDSCCAPPSSFLDMIHSINNNWLYNGDEAISSFKYNWSSASMANIMQDISKCLTTVSLDVSLAEHKSQEEQEARENMELVIKHLASEEIEKMMEGSENVIDDSLPPRNDKPQIPGTRLEPRSDKESPEVEITNDEEVEITNVVIPVNVNEEEEEITDEVYELNQREKGKIIEESRSTPFSTPIRSPRTHTNLISSDAEKLQELTVIDTQTTSSSRSPNINLSKTNRILSLFKAKHARFKRYKNFFQELQGCYTYLFGHLKERFFSKKSFDTLADHLQEVMVESLPTMVDTNIKEQVKKKVLEQVSQTTCRPSAVRPRDQDDPHDDAHPEGENSAKRQKTSEYEAYVSRESSSGQVNEEERGPSTSGNQEQVDDYDFWTDSYASDDDEIPMKQVSQDIMEEVSLTIDEAKLKKMADEMLRQRCTSGDEHQYHIDQMKNFLKNPEAPTLSLINQDLLYLNKGSSGPEKIVLSLHKFPAIIFNDDDIEERTSRWVNKCVKKFNPYARYGVEHWKNPHAKIFYIKKQKEPGKPKEEVYSNSKIIQVIKTYWELGHEHKFITEIVARRANDCIVSITEPDYKNLNKNDIEDIYLLIINGKVPDYAETGLLWSLSVFIRSSVIWERVHDFQLGIESYQQKVNLTAPTISFPGVEKHKMFSIIYDPVHGIIYKTSKKKKRVMRHSEIHKFCDATLIRVLEGLKSYNNDVKYGYVQRELMNDEVEYLKLFEEEIEVRLKYRNQMRRWEMYVNGRPLGPRRECLE
ncbi:hypothetical protein Tco_0718578 [Tanacetum coccineum]